MKKETRIIFEDTLTTLFRFLENGKQERITFTNYYGRVKYEHSVIFGKNISSIHKNLIKHVCVATNNDDYRNTQIEWYAFHPGRKRKFELITDKNTVNPIIKLFSDRSIIDFDHVFEKIALLIVDCV